MFTDNYGMSFSPSFVNNSPKRAAFVLMPVFLEVVDFLKFQIVLCIDDSVHKYMGRFTCIWVFRGNSLVGYRIGTRSRAMLGKTAGNGCPGGMVCGCFSACPSFQKDHPQILVQHCLAHLARDFENRGRHLGPGFEDVSGFGKIDEDLVRTLIHEYNEDRRIRESGADSPESEAARRVGLLDLRGRLRGHALKGPDAIPKSRGIKKRFVERGGSCFTFLDRPDIPPTNNDAERSLREYVTGRHISFGSQSLAGNCCLEVSIQFFRRRNSTTST
jgi:hypothetical protein